MMLVNLHDGVAHAVTHDAIDHDRVVGVVVGAI